MKPRTVIALWIVAIALGAAVFFIKNKQGNKGDNTTSRTPGQKLIADFPAAEATTIKISGSDQSLTLEQKDGKWTVAERDSYPANTRNINDLLRTLSEIKVIQGIKAGPSFAARFGMNPDSSDPKARGITATFLGKDGKEIAKISFGKNLESADSSSPYGGGATGRYIRNHADESGFYAVSEVFGSLSTDPKSWLADDFIQIEKISSISLSKPGSEGNEWTLVRDDENAEFKFTDAFPGVKIDTAATSPLKSLFSYARFDDVLPATKIAERATPEKLQKAAIATFEGFNYEITLQPAKATTPAAPAAEGAPPADEEFLMEIKANAELPKERKKPESEKPEDTEAADKMFAERLKTLTERLEKAKALEGRTFLVSKFTVDALLKARAELMSKGPGPGAEAPAPPPGTAAFTPPVQIPAQPSPEAPPEE